VTAGTYRVHGLVRAVVAGSGSTQKYQTRYNGSAGLSAMLVVTLSLLESNNTTIGVGQTTAFAADESNSFPSNPALNSNIYWMIDGEITFSSAGNLTFGLRCNTSGANASCTVQTGSYLELMPVT